MKLNSQKKEVDFKNSLGFHIDPWDHYLYFDSVFFMKILLHKVIEILLKDFLDWKHQILVLSFVLRSVETDTISFFDQQHPNDLLIDLFEFAR